MARRAMLRLGACAALLLAATGVAAGTAFSAQQKASPVTLQDPELAHSDYLENCAGCHGIEGRSAPAELPELRGRVGWFMCTPEARAYLLRLPNVAHSRIADNAELADLMNYVVFTLGEASVPKGTQPFTAEEVAHERKFALSNASLTAERARHAGEAIRKCRAPASLRQLFVR